jgi:hypothetical protein
MKKLLSNYLLSNKKFTSVIKNIQRHKISLINGLSLSAKEILLSILFDEPKKPFVVCFSSMARLLRFWEVVKELSDKKIEFLQLKSNRLMNFYILMCLCSIKI